MAQHALSGTCLSKPVTSDSLLQEDPSEAEAELLPLKDSPRKALLQHKKKGKWKMSVPYPSRLVRPRDLVI